MKILVTGGAGFIGSNFIKYMLEKYPDYKIINLDALTYCGNLINLKEVENNPNYTFIHGNICNADTVKNAIIGVDCIINFAAESHVDNSIWHPEYFVGTNIHGTLNLLQAAKEAKIERFIQISTDEVYGSIQTGFANESSPICPSSPYSASKASADLLVEAFYKTYHLPILITRCSNNYGPFQYPEKLIPFFISKLLKKEKVPIYGNGLNKRDWIYVYDHCRAIDLVMHNGKDGNIYNIGSHNERSNLDITRCILKNIGLDESYIEFVEDRPGHDLRYAISYDKISSELGWQPTYDFEENINRTIGWYLNNPDWFKIVNYDDIYFDREKSISNRS